jgi:hypothetical protein
MRRPKPARESDKLAAHHDLSLERAALLGLPDRLIPARLKERHRRLDDSGEIRSEIGDESSTEPDAAVRRQDVQHQQRPVTDPDQRYRRVLPVYLREQQPALKRVSLQRAPSDERRMPPLV